jgi:hypothetical protein
VLGVQSGVWRRARSGAVPGHDPSWALSGRSSAVSRRDLLRGVLAVAGLAGVGSVAGCDLIGGSSDADDPDVPPEITELLTATVALADAYDGAIARVPSLAERLTPMRDTHRTHAQALAQALAEPTPASATADGPSDPAAALAELVDAETRGLEAARSACLAAPARLAGLIGSMAAARACHLEVLQ